MTTKKDPPLKSPDGEYVRDPKTQHWHTGRAFYYLLGSTNMVKTSTAVAMGTTPQTLYRWMKQQHWPDRQIMKAAAHLGASPEWLRDGIGEIYVSPTGGTDPRDIRAERMLMQLEARVSELLKTYSHDLAVLFGKDPNALPADKGKKREWNTRPTKGFL